MSVAKRARVTRWAAIDRLSDAAMQAAADREPTVDEILKMDLPESETPLGDTLRQAPFYDVFVAPILASPRLLALTLGTYTILAYFLIFRKTDDDDQRFKGEEYFQAVVGELDSFNDAAGTMSGHEQGCDWMQTDDEVVVIAPMPDGARSKDCQCKVLEHSLSVRIRGDAIVDGKLFRRVQPDESDWTIEEVNGRRIFKLTLVKLTPTKGTQHWTSLLLPPEV